MEEITITMPITRRVTFYVPRFAKYGPTYYAVLSENRSLVADTSAEHLKMEVLSYAASNAFHEDAIEITADEFYKEWVRLGGTIIGQ